MLLVRRMAMMILLAACGAVPAWAQALPDLSGPVILTVMGLDPTLFDGGTAEFDEGRLLALGQSSITTSTIWTEGVHVYDGVMMMTLLRYLKIEDRQLTLTALNDYSIDLPADEITTAAPILALHMDGKPMSVRDKGPLWVLFPFDRDAQYRTDINYARSIWQLNRIDVMP
jgi:hypothetical protein